MIYFNELKFVSLFNLQKCNIYLHIYTCTLLKMKSRHNITEILLKVALNTIKQTKWNKNSPSKDTSTSTSAKKKPFELIIVRRPYITNVRPDILFKKPLGYNSSLNTKHEGKKEENCRKSEWQHVFQISLVTFTIRLIVVGSLW